MPDPLLRLYDGYPHTSPQLRDTVRELQAMLRRHDRAVVIDGLFGRGTEDLVRSFQRSRGLRSDGVVGPDTWHALLDPETPAASDHFATTYPLDHPILLEDLEAAARYGATIIAAAGDFGLPPALIVALGSRESRWGLALSPKGPTGTGDLTPRSLLGPHRTGPLPADGRGFGRGLMQIDHDAHEFARSGPWHEPDANVRYACSVLAGFRPILRGRTVLHGAALTRATLAAYNCGLDNVLRAVRYGLDLDFYTAGRDYAREVLSRAGFFEAHGWD
jgi:Putative peptidoglycan binding domain/Transglycosylase SLT domain